MEILSVILTSSPCDIETGVESEQLVEARFLGRLILEFVGWQVLWIPTRMCLSLKKRKKKKGIYFFKCNLQALIFFQKNLNIFLVSSSIFNRFQSGFPAVGRTESALSKGPNDLHAGFDAVHHDIHSKRPEDEVGPQGPVLNWFILPERKRRLSVRVENASAPVKCGVRHECIPHRSHRHTLPLC